MLIRFIRICIDWLSIYGGVVEGSTKLESASPQAVDSALSPDPFSHKAVLSAAEGSEYKDFS